ncbi:hypothetical protein F5Y17DRAFT_190133 [Xylariaceae sp. FL0594]|nr:hypothetical protein F5Y17DRAFT_190133 [Xylariaceae sp. FL0594]
MTRPKVDPDKRQRTAQACESCKRRKQKCNGLKPCNTCTKRNISCHYAPASLDQPNGPDCLNSPTKRRHIDSSPMTIASSIDVAQPASRRNSSLALWAAPAETADMDIDRALAVGSHQSKHIGASRHLLGGTDSDFDSHSGLSNGSVAADESGVPFKRMLQDPSGRLLYIGDAASLSFLQWVRMIVENVSGVSEFTQDPSRHKLMENVISLPADSRPTGVLPDQRTAMILIDSFFINTTGLVEIFNKQAFLRSVEVCYTDPLDVKPWFLCLMYLVFAVGLVMAAPSPESDEAKVIANLRSKNRAELFFRNAKSLADPVTGFEDADFWSIQALLLISLYMLGVSKRNAAYAYYGMAVRSAFALGLHRDESLSVFGEPEKLVRKNLWKSLFILDRFVSACLGRPTAISEDDCSPCTFGFSESANGASADLGPERTHLAALETAVKSSQAIGVILKNIYSNRKVSTYEANEIAVSLKEWNKELPGCLHWRRLVNGGLDPSQGIAILHSNLLHCHSVILLSRPFFLYLLNQGRLGVMGGKYSKTPRACQKMEDFAQTCLQASQHTLALAQAVLDRKYLPQCNPFVIHCVFAAALIVLSNEFAMLYHNPEARVSINSAIAILRFCAQNDKQAERVLFIVESFDKANEERPSDAKRLLLPGRKTPTLATSSQCSNFDPVKYFFRSVNREGAGAPVTASTFAGEESILVHSTPAPVAPMAPLIPSTTQQPSPEGSVSMSSGITTTTTGLAQGVDSMSGPDAVFDLDTMWSGWNNASNMPVHHPAPAFNHYDLGHSQAYQAIVGPAVMYHPSDYR